MKREKSLVLAEREVTFGEQADRRATMGLPLASLKDSANRLAVKSKVDKVSRRPIDLRLGGRYRPTGVETRSASTDRQRLPPRLREKGGQCRTSVDSDVEIVRQIIQAGLKGRLQTA